MARSRPADAATPPVANISHGSHRAGACQLARKTAFIGADLGQHKQSAKPHLNGATCVLGRGHRCNTPKTFFGAGGEVCQFARHAQIDFIKKTFQNFKPE